MKSASILPFHFLMMTIYGIWCPVHWSPIKKNFHKLYTILAITLMFSLVSLQLAKVIFVRLTWDEFTETIYMNIATVAACIKSTNFLAHREHVLQLIDMFRVDFCFARDECERNLKLKYDETCTFIGKASLLWVKSTVIAFVITSLIQDIKIRKLPLEVFELYDTSNPIIYGLSYLHHVYCAAVFGGINIVTDAMIAAFMLQVCSQLDIISHRLNNFPLQARRMNSHVEADEIVETHLLKEIIRHHVHVYKIAELIMSTFNEIIAVQFYASTLQICLSVYQLTLRGSSTVDMITNGFFLVCMLLEPGVLCYFGNELTEKSVSLRDAVYNTNWMSLTTITKKNLIFMICRAGKSIEITDGAYVRLTLQTFASIIKLAYSAFSVIKSSK